MSWKLDKNRPICPQITEQICVKIANGELGAGEKLPSVRDVALAAGVNPNTVQKSFEQLEQNGIIYSVRGSGCFVTDDVSVAKETIKKLTEEKTRNYFGEMKLLGFSDEEIKNYVEEWMK